MPLMTWKLASLDKLFTLDMYETGSLFIRLFEDLQAKMGDEFFTICSKFEVLMKGAILMRPDDLGFTDLYTSAVNKINSYRFLKSDYSEHGYKTGIRSTTSEIDCIIKLTESVALQDPALGFDLCSLTKCFGHPNLDDAAGLEKLREESCKIVDVDDDLICEITATLRYIICT